MSNLNNPLSDKQKKWLSGSIEEYSSSEKISSPKLKKMLSNIDLNIVTRIANRHLAKAQVKKEQSTHAFDFKQISVADDNLQLVKMSREMGPVMFEMTTGNIYFNPRHFFRLMHKIIKHIPEKEKDTMLQALTILSLFHEVVHKMSLNWHPEGEDKIQMHSGMEKRTLTLNEHGHAVDQKHNFLEMLDEVVARKLELDMSLEYLQNASIAGVSEQSLRDAHQIVLDAGGRTQGQRTLNDFVRKLAEKADLPEDVVWAGFKEAFFTNRDIEGIKKDMEKFTGVDIVSEMQFQDLMNSLGFE
ncbi:hypothetical protein HY969_03825 [Candidatus Kaiserbacteria bacterium]|nr:hypothetical protein [Candidatus Kaiserbacteria bacterium]